MKLKNIKTQIAEYFFVNPTVKLRVRHIEKKLKLPIPSVIRYTKELEKEGILKKEAIANIFIYSADRVSRNYLVEKKVFNIKLIFESELIDYLIKEYSNPVVILFGSYSKGEDIENSDIDLYIETPKKHEFNLQKFEKSLMRNIQIFNYKNINEVPNLHLANNIINGIVLNNFLEVFK